MALLTGTAVRIFKHGDMKLPDPDPNMTPDEVRELYANTYVSLTNGSVDGPEINDDGEAVYEFTEHVGSKG